MFHTIMFPTSLSGGNAGGDTYEVTITGDHLNFNLFNYLTNLEGAALSNYGTINVTFDVNCKIGASSTSGYAFTTGSGWASGTTINLTNNGTIVGAGGAGGLNADNGGAGGNAMFFTLDASLTNNGTIGGGGGGGGGGVESDFIFGNTTVSESGGGGGAGYFAGLGGATFLLGPSGDTSEVQNNGQLTEGGAGHLDGGDGGDLGQAGSNGGGGTTGGAAGDAIHKNGFTVPVTGSGTVSGTVSATT